MSDRMKSLYASVIREHNAKPFHFEQPPAPPLTLRAYNPLCGDRYDLFPFIENNAIAHFHFHGFGCAISKASASLMARALEGKTLPEAREACLHFITFLNNPQENKVDGDLMAFSSIAEFPERFDCAALPWLEMKKYLDGIG